MMADVWIALAQQRWLAYVIESVVQKYSWTVGGACLAHGVQREVLSDKTLHLEVGKQQIQWTDRVVVRHLIHEVSNQRDAHRVVVPTADKS